MMTQNGRVTSHTNLKIQKIQQKFNKFKIIQKFKVKIQFFEKYQHFNTFDTGIVNELIHDKN
jgi:hypothetical protein